MCAARFQILSARHRNRCRPNNTRTPAPDELPADQAVVAGPAQPGCALYSDVPVTDLRHAPSNFPIVNSAQERERSLDRDLQRADKAARFALALPDLHTNRKDHALAQKRDKLRRFPLASASSAISPRETASPAAPWQFRARDRSGVRKRRS